MALTRDQIINADDLPRVRVDVPEWAPSGTKPEDAFVFVRMLTASEKDAFDDENYKLKGKETVVNRKDFTARLLARVLCDDGGKPIFKANEVAELGRKSEAVLSRLEAAALKISKMDKEADEELARPTGDPANSSSTDSPGS